MGIDQDIILIYFPAIRFAGMYIYRIILHSYSSACLGRAIYLDLCSCGLNNMVIVKYSLATKIVAGSIYYVYCVIMKQVEKYFTKCIEDWENIYHKRRFENESKR